MVTGATSLSLVRDELFATMEQAEQGLEQFIAERQNGSLLQHAVECLQQIRGTLNLIELAGAELLAQEALQLATDIPTGVSEERDGQLAALGNALYVLRRYLENVEANRQEIPELLLPAINEVRCAAGQHSLTNLHAQLGKLSKTLGMVGLNSAGTALQTQLPTVAAWAASGVADSPPALLRLADAVLYVESMVGNLERGERRIIRPTPAEPGQEADAFAVHQLAEARIVVIEEAKAGLALAKRAITAYLESNGDKLNLANVPASLQAVRGGLWFLGQERAALLVGGCADYIQQRMIETAQMPSEQMLETLADALTSLEYYLEGGAVLRPQGQPDVLDLASASVKALGLPVAA
ncbi:hypothetical protein FA550_15595 [Pseudomonas aeruginosa]|nr:hypothetical protein [Pseudomonas aeruginosa]